jgi:hypothetical protein
MIYPVVTLLIGISSTLLILFLKERLKRNTKIKLERIKLYDKKRFNAYNSLYGFINKSFSLFPLERPREDFVYLIKDHYLLKVRQHLPYFRKDIRGKLNPHCSFGFVMC